MRLGSYNCKLRPDSKAAQAYKSQNIIERHRHRYEVNNTLLPELEKAGLIVSGRSTDSNLVEMIEMQDHPWFLACQFHPEFTSHLETPNPIILEFVKQANSLK